MPVYKDKVKNTYNISYYLNGKRIFRRTNIKNEKDAKKYEKELRGNSKSLKFSDLYKKFMNYKLNIYKENTLLVYEYVYKNNLIDFYDLMINDININHVLNLQLKLLNNYSKQRINVVLRCLRSILDFGCKFYNLNKNVAKNVDNFRIEDKNVVNDNYLSYDEFKLFIKYVDDKMYFIIFNIMFFYGLRISELLALRANDFKDSTMKIDESMLSKVPKVYKGMKRVSTTKNNKVNYFNLSSWIWILINDYIKEKNLKKKDFVFGINGYSLPETTYRRKHNHYFKLSGVKRITAHGFRHSCASFYLSQGIDLVFVQKLLRHKTIDITIKYYVHFYKKDLDKINDLVDKFEVAIN